ncbi:PilZ domain-containing protein [Methylocystis parvus]|uniref:PilZ domain-containing protein n=1 Tax=Methylocystis parvus TaxID=134 RepID=UPI003C748094
MVERRRHYRRRTLLSGKIEFFGRSTFECVVRDLSEAGARLRCDQHIALPDILDLVIEKTSERRCAQVVWRQESEIGLAFAPNVLRLDARRPPTGDGPSA